MKKLRFAEFCDSDYNVTHCHTGTLCFIYLLHNLKFSWFFCCPLSIFCAIDSHSSSLLKNVAHEKRSVVVDQDDHDDHDVFDSPRLT